MSGNFMEARNPLFTEATKSQVLELERLGWYHSISLPDGQVIRGHQSLDQLQWRLAQFPVPERLEGKRVLDIGAWDGWFTFEMERRGAQVVAIDSFPRERFLIAKELLGSKAEYRLADIQRLKPADFGSFDIVLFFGVLYHLKHPLLALENVCELASEMAFVESYVTGDSSDPNAVPAMEFYEGRELRGQFDNWCGPNISCLMAFCRAAGFARAERRSVESNRAHIACYRTWEQHGAKLFDGEAPFLIGAQNSILGDESFSSARDDYLSLWFKSAQTDLNCANVYPQIGRFASRPVAVASTGAGGWQIDCKLPLGLGRGRHEITVTVEGSKRSNAIAIGVDEPLASVPGLASAGPLRINLVTDGLTWDRYRVRIGGRACVSVWVAGLPSEVDRSKVHLQLDETVLPVTFVSPLDSDGLCQLNAFLPTDAGPGNAWIRVLYGGGESDPVQVLLLTEAP